MSLTGVGDVVESPQQPNLRVSCPQLLNTDERRSHMALAILIEEFETEYGQVRFWISIRVDPGRAPIPSLEIDLPDGSGGGGGKWNTFEPPSLEIRLEDSGALWLYGVVQTDIREVTCGDVVGTIVRPSHCSLAFFALRVGQQRSGQVTFTTEDGVSTARSFEY